MIGGDFRVSQMAYHTQTVFTFSSVMICLKGKAFDMGFNQITIFSQSV